MGTIIAVGDDILSYSEFVALNESVEPKIVNYGTDSQNKHWDITVSKSTVYTFFSLSESHHIVVTMGLAAGFIGFGALNGKFSSNYKLYLEDRMSLSKALNIINKVFYVALQGAKKFDIKSLRFKGYDPQLCDFYDRIIENKFFQKHLQTAGYEYQGKIKDNHTFVRI